MKYGRPIADVADGQPKQALTAPSATWFARWNAGFVLGIIGPGAYAISFYYLMRAIAALPDLVREIVGVVAMVLGFVLIPIWTYSAAYYLVSRHERER